jgi:hypothetical protein
MLKITEMDFNRKRDRNGHQETSVGSDSEDGSSLDGGGSSYVADLPYLETGKQIRATLCHPHSRTSMRSPSSPTHEGGGGGISVTGTRTSMFGSHERKENNKSPKNYLSAKNLPQTKLIYGRGSYRKPQRPSTPNSPGTVSANSASFQNSPEGNRSVNLHEWLSNVMAQGSTATAASSIDLASDRPSSRGVGGGISLSSLGSAEVHLASFSPHQGASIRGSAGPLSDDDGDGEEEGEFGLGTAYRFPDSPLHASLSSSSSHATAPATSDPAAVTTTSLCGSDLLYSTYHTDGGDSSLRYGISGGSWDPKRTKPIRRRAQTQRENMKLKISKAVARSRAKYSIPDYVSEATRGRNPLIPAEQRAGGGAGGGMDIIELLSESVRDEKRKMIPDHRATAPAATAAASASMGSLITGLSLTSLSPSSSSPPRQLLSLQSHHLPHRPHSPSNNSAKDKGKERKQPQEQQQQFFLTEAMASQESQKSFLGATKPVTATSAAAVHELKYFLDSSSLSKDQMGRPPPSHLMIPTDRTAPEVFIVSKYHPSISQFGTLPSLPTASGPSLHLSSQSILQPHAADPFAAYGPWIPKGGMGVMVSDKSDPLLSWEENRDIAKYCPCDNTEVRTVLKRQNVIRSSFEGFSRTGGFTSQT